MSKKLSVGYVMVTLQRLHKRLKPLIALATVLALVITSSWVIGEMTPNVVSVKMTQVWVQQLLAAVTFYWCVRIVFWGATDTHRKGPLE